MTIPHLFRCPISLDLFTDPVTLSTGQTYDRPSIERWLADGNLTCPVTMQRLHDTTLVPNHTLRHLIDQWLLAGADLDSRHRSMKSINDTELSLATLRHNLRSPGTDRAATLETLKKVRLLSLESEIGQACLIQLGFFPLLLQLLFQQSPRIGDTELAEVALDCVLSLSPSTHLDALNMLTEDSSFASLEFWFDQGSGKTKTSLCCLLEATATATATSPASQELCLMVGRSRRVLQALVSLLHDKSDAGASEAAARAVSVICSVEANRASAIREGAVDGIVSFLLLSSTPTKVAPATLEALELLLGVEAGRRALVKNRNAARALVKQVFRVSSDHEGSEHAVGSLLIACRESARLQVEAVNAGLLTQLLLLLQSQCGSRAKAKARALLKLLRSMWAEDPGECNFYKAK